MVNCNLDKLSFLADVKNIRKMYKCLFCCLRCSTIEITRCFATGACVCAYIFKTCLDMNQRQPCSMTTQTEIQFSAGKLTNLSII